MDIRRAPKWLGEQGGTLQRFCYPDLEIIVMIGTTSSGFALHVTVRKSISKKSEGGRDRTFDTLLKRQVLYH